MRTAESDLTTRARIRDAAVDLFGRQGFGVGLRAIADRAGVSLGLIRHHFGSKDDLQAVCDRFVLDQIADLQAEKVEGDPASELLRNMMELDSYQPLVRYFLRALQTGGDLARAFMDRLVADSTTYLEQGVANGIIQPSIDPAARARYIVMISLGGMLLQYALADDGEDTLTTWRRYVDRATLPALELYTQGLLTDRRMLDAYLDFVKDPPTEAADAD